MTSGSVRQELNEWKILSALDLDRRTKADLGWFQAWFRLTTDNILAVHFFYLKINKIHKLWDGSIKLKLKENRFRPSVKLSTSIVVDYKIFCKLY